MTKETAKKLGSKVKFNNKLAEALDDTVIALVNKTILNKLAEKLSDEVLAVVQEAIVTVVDEMPEIEI